MHASWAPIHYRNSDPESLVHSLLRANRHWSCGKALPLLCIHLCTLSSVQPGISCVRSVHTIAMPCRECTRHAALTTPRCACAHIRHRTTSWTAELARRSISMHAHRLVRVLVCGVLWPVLRLLQFRQVACYRPYRQLSKLAREQTGKPHLLLNSQTVYMLTRYCPDSSRQATATVYWQHGLLEGMCARLSY
jgi:hypothetical protein